jgi:hypothetical protein
MVRGSERYNRPNDQRASYRPMNLQPDKQQLVKWAGKIPDQRGGIPRRRKETARKRLRRISGISPGVQGGGVLS